MKTIEEDKRDVEESERTAFIFYKSYYDAAMQIPDKKQRAEYILSICAYAFTGIEPKLTGTASACWTLTKPTMDANDKRRKNGSKGGRPASDSKPTVTRKKKPMVSENGNQNKTNGYSCEKPNPSLIKDKGQGTRDKGQGTRDEGQQTVETDEPPVSLLSEIESFCLSNGGTAAQAAAFYAQYDRSGWMASGKPIENWRGLCLNFIRAGGGKGAEGKIPLPSRSPASDDRIAANREWMRRMLEEDDNG